MTELAELYDRLNALLLRYYESGLREDGEAYIAAWKEYDALVPLYIWGSSND